MVEGAGDEASAVDFHDKVVADPTELAAVDVLNESLVTAAVNLDADATTLLDNAFRGYVLYRERHSLDVFLTKVLRGIIAFSDETASGVSPLEFLAEVANMGPR